VICNEFDARPATAYLAAHTLTFPGARDRQAQLRLDLPVPGGSVHLKSGTRGNGQVNGPVSIVDRDLSQRRDHPRRDISTRKSPVIPVHSTSLALVEILAGPVAVFNCRSPLSIDKSPGIETTSTSVRLE
jgi:hypothetical protein